MVVKSFTTHLINLINYSLKINPSYIVKAVSVVGTAFVFVD